MLDFTQETLSNTAVEALPDLTHLLAQVRANGLTAEQALAASVTSMAAAATWVFASFIEMVHPDYDERQVGLALMGFMAGCESKGNEWFNAILVGWQDA
jgi:hypothetical protein